MNKSAQHQVVKQDGLPWVRFFMVISSLSPLFLLWAIRGVTPISDSILIPSTFFVIIGSHFVVFWRFRITKKRNDKHPFVTGKIEDNQHYVLVYLLATLLPFYRGEIESLRDIFATFAGLVIIIFIFMRLNLHYMNIGFVALGYRIYTISDPKLPNLDSTGLRIILITKRRTIDEGTSLTAYRISDTVYWESDG